MVSVQSLELTDPHMRSQSRWPGHPGKESYHWRRTCMGITEGGHLVIIFDVDTLLPVSVSFSLLIKADL